MPGRWNSARSPRRARGDDAPGQQPSLIEPQLATLVDRPPPAHGWSYEIKVRRLPADVPSQLRCGENLYSQRA